jgi:riboflavin kinase/FMN adenylyltransferase
MSVERELSSITPAQNSLISIGVFDGVHAGHKELLSQLVKKARENNLLSIAITFKQHPQKLLTPNEYVPLIVSLAERIRLIKALGIDMVLTLTFDAELAQLGAQSFVLMLQRYLKMQGLVLGWDFAMGHSREGSLETLQEMGHSLGFSLDVVGPVKINNDVISSTAIRQALAQGDIARANAMLGRTFHLEGTVVSGNGRGTELGFPTANLDIDPLQVLPADGVYATLAYVEGKQYKSATFIGRRPTFNGLERIVEVHILDYAGDLYRSTLKIDIIERLRGEQKFPNADALKSQISRDIILAKERLATVLK